MRTVQKAASWFGGINFILGLLSFYGPAVTGNDDDLINVKPGLLFGQIAVNGPHALLHLVWGVLGLLARAAAGMAQGYMLATAALFGFLSFMGLRSFGFQRGIHMMMGMAVDWKGNVVHLAWTVVGLFFALQPGRPHREN